MTKVVGIDTKQKPVDDTCMFCGGPHPHLHCERLKSAEFYEDGQLAVVEYFEPKPKQ